MLMRARLARDVHRVLDECDLARGCSRERPELAVEVGLVGVAAVVGDVGERAALAQLAHRALEAQDARDGLRAQPDVAPPARREVAALQPTSLASGPIASRPSAAASRRNVHATSGAGAGPAATRRSSAASSSAKRSRQPGASCRRSTSSGASGPSTSSSATTRLVSSSIGSPRQRRAPSGVKSTWTPPAAPTNSVRMGRSLRPPTNVSKSAPSSRYGTPKQTIATAPAHGTSTR